MFSFVVNVNVNVNNLLARGPGSGGPVHSSAGRGLVVGAADGAGRRGRRGNASTGGGWRVAAALVPWLACEAGFGWQAVSGGT